MSEFELSDASFFHSINSLAQTKIQRPKLSLKLLSNSHIFVDWRDLKTYSNVHQYVIHYKSLNSNRNYTLHVSRNKKQAIIEKVEAGHLYEIHVCGIDDSKGIITSSEPAQIQTIVADEAPLLYVTKSTPDFIILEWEPAKSVKLSDVELYRVIINRNTVALLPPTENKFIVNDGQIGKRYSFKLEMLRKNQKLISSLPVLIDWPGVTLPKTHAFVNGNDEVVICWGYSRSINDGNIESYTVHLYDSEGLVLNRFGPNSSECRQVWIKDLAKGVYLYALEIKLANSKKSILSQPARIECGRESNRPILKCNRSDADEENQLIHITQHLINIHDNIKAKHLLGKCETQLNQVLSTLTNLTNSIHLNLTLESRSNDKNLKTYHLIVDGQENSLAIPGLVKDFPISLPRREKPYELAISVTPALYGTKSNTVLIEASGHFTFFCTHFNERLSKESCSYLRTLSYETQLAKPVHQGSILSPKPMTKIEVYDLNHNEILFFPPSKESTRLSIVLFYVNTCVPARLHLNYFSNYASTCTSKYNFISINCNRNDIDEVKSLTENLKDIESYTDFSSEDFKYEQKNDERPINEILSIQGVPFYFVLDYSGNLVWKGRLCVPNQFEYNEALDHILNEILHFPCSKENCDRCYYSSLTEADIDLQLKQVERKFQSTLRNRIEQYENQTNRRNRNPLLRVYSMKQTRLLQ